MPRKLADHDVTELRRAAAAGPSPAELAARFGISRQHASRLILGQQRVMVGPSRPGAISAATEAFLADLEADPRGLVLAALTRGIAQKLDALAGSDSAAAAVASERLAARLALLLRELESAAVQSPGPLSKAEMRALLRPLEGARDGA